MNIRAAWIFVLAVSAVFAGPDAGSTRTASGPAPDSPYLEETIHSSILDEERHLLIRLPRGYDTAGPTRYPVLYKLDGDNGLRSFEESLVALQGSPGVPEMIFVAIPNGRGRRNRDLTPANLHQESPDDGGLGTGEMGRGDRFLDFIEQELIPHVDKTYQTKPERFLVGHSRGALLVLQSLLDKPELFEARFVFSAPLMRDEQRLIADTRNFLAEHPNLRSSIYFNWGERENEGMNRSCAAIEKLFTEAAPKGLRWKVERAPAADHQQTPLLAFPSAVKWLFAAGGSSSEPARGSGLSGKR